MKKVLFIVLLLCLSVISLSAKTETLVSPNGNIKLSVNVGEGLSFNVYSGSESLLQADIAVKVGNEVLGKNPRLSSTKRSKVNEQIKAVVPIKNAVILNEANEMTMSFKGGYAVVFRAYNNGYAYRFVLKKKGRIEVTDEEMELNLPSAYLAHLQQTGSFTTSCEQPYSHMSTSDYKADDPMSDLPMLLESPAGTKLLFSESDVRDYPHMFIKSNGKNGLYSVFSKSPIEWQPSGDRGFEATKFADAIAVTDGTRSLPWRFAVIGDDATIASNQMEAVLGGKCEIEDTTWIKPGKVIWDWWNHWAVWNVDFEVGINNDTYKYFIDFAAKYGIEYILLDEGWCKNVENPYVTIDKINVKELVDYGRSKGVGVILWMTWRAVEYNMDVIKYYADMGVKGLKIDFMDNSTQWMVNYYERVTKECAKNHLLVDYHGSFKPAGLEQRYPNLLSYEGVRGMENCGSCTPENSIWLPFMRNAVGPMDFTPGSMESSQPEYNHQSGVVASGVGTRAYQMALYVCFETGIQMLADSPTRYLREDECARYIAMVPTTWDESRVLSAKAGKHYVVARRKGNKWFIGAMGNQDAQDINIKLDFLSKDATLTSFEDGKNAARIAVDYKKVQQNVNPGTEMTLHLVRNGGWFGVIE